MKDSIDMNFDEEYLKIEAGIPTIEDLLTVPVEDCGEGLVDLAQKPEFAVSFHNMEAMMELVGPRMLVRESVYRLLLEADGFLKQMDPDLQFEIFYGYRPLEVQQKYWDRACEKFRNELGTDDESVISAAAQRLSADPRVAGHPTGGSVDLTLMNKKLDVRLDMGVGVERAAFYRAGKLIYTESPEISQRTLNCRLLLREVMQRAGFTSFAAEFWHFDYGNREWAFVSKAGRAIYAPLAVEDALRMII